MIEFTEAELELVQNMAERADGIVVSMDAIEHRTYAALLAYGLVKKGVLKPKGLVMHGKFREFELMPHFKQLFSEPVETDTEKWN